MSVQEKERQPTRYWNNGDEMNLGHYNRMMVKGSGPRQHILEWRIFLEICESHFKEHRIGRPVVVELGTFKNHQKKFYEHFLGAEHIGININAKHEMPDIMGDTHDPDTLNRLKKRLGKRSINLLYIDASHTYASVKEDYETLSPLCSDIVAFHDIETGRYADNKNDGAWKFWEELRLTQYRNPKTDWKFVSIHMRHFKGVKARALGIGVIVKR